MERSQVGSAHPRGGTFWVLLALPASVPYLADGGLLRWTSGAAFPRVITSWAEKLSEAPHVAVSLRQEDLVQASEVSMAVVFAVAAGPSLQHGPSN